MNFSLMYSYQGTFRVAGSSFFVDLFLDFADNSLNVWLFNQHVGIKSYIFGISVDRIGCIAPDKLDEVFDLIDSNIDEYIDSYREEFMSDEVSD